jgi:hypothetical protein
MHGQRFTLRQQFINNNLGGNMNFIKIITVTGLVSVSFNSFSATCSCAGVPLLNSMNSTSVDQNQWFLNLTYEHHEMNKLYSGSDEFNDETNRKRETDSYIIQVDYGINKVWSVSTMLSYVDHEREIGQSNNSLSSASDVGDGLILLKYTPEKINLFSKWEYSIGVGVKIPLGENNATQNSIKLSEDMQPSSGSYSALAWGYVGYAFDRSAQTQIFMSSNYTLNQENDRNYANGNEFNIGIGASYTMKENWGFVAQLRYKTTKADERNGDAIPNTGGEWIDFIPNVQYRINDKSGINLGFRIPLYRDLDGALQFTTSSAVTLGYSYAF